MRSILAILLLAAFAAPPASAWDTAPDGSGSITSFKAGNIYYHLMAADTDSATADARECRGWWFGHVTVSGTNTSELHNSIDSDTHLDLLAGPYADGEGFGDVYPLGHVRAVANWTSGSGIAVFNCGKG